MDILNSLKRKATETLQQKVVVPLAEVSARNQAKRDLDHVAFLLKQTNSLNLNERQRAEEELAGLPEELVEIVQGQMNEGKRMRAYIGDDALHIADLHLRPVAKKKK